MCVKKHMRVDLRGAGYSNNELSPVKELGACISQDHVPLQGPVTGIHPEDVGDF